MFSLSTALRYLNIAFCVQATVVVRKYNSQTVPSAGWFPQTTFNSVKTLQDCETKARDVQQYSFSYDAASKTCQAGYVDFSIGGTGDVQIHTIDIGQVGIAQGGHYVTDFEVVLPNGKVCPPSENGLPALSAGRRRHGMAEMDGIIYVCGGEFDNGADTDECQTLDLNSATPSWQPMPSLPKVTLMAFERGLVAHKNKDGEVVLFAFHNFCQATNPAPYFRNGAWHEGGLLTSRKEYATAHDKSLVYLVSGDQCSNSNLRHNTVAVFDLDEPSEDAKLLSHDIPYGVRRPSCAVMRVGSQKGLLCVGGNHNNNAKSKLAQFVVLTEDGRDSTSDWQTLTPLPGLRTHTAMFHFPDAGTALLYAGHNSNGVVTTILEWNTDDQIFENTGRTTEVSRNQAAATMIDSKWVREKCWKYLG